MKSSIPQRDIQSGDFTDAGCERRQSVCNQGGMAVVALEGNGARPSHKGSGYSRTYQLYAERTEQHGVAYGIDRATITWVRMRSSGSRSRRKSSYDGGEGTGAVGIRLYTSKNSYIWKRGGRGEHVVATDYKDHDIRKNRIHCPQAHADECARLQGFPDGGAMISARQAVDEELYIGTRCSRHGGWQPSDSKPRLQRDKEVACQSYSILRSTRCGATAWLCRAWFSCFRALCITHSFRPNNPAVILQRKIRYSLAIPGF
jgi:hypothetical protein